MKHTLFLLGLSGALWAQSGADTSRGAPGGDARDGKTRVFVTDSDSWQMSGGFGGGGSAGNGGIAGNTSGGARPQTAEIMKTFGERCPEVTVTINRERADYIVILEHEGGKELFQRDNKLAIFNKDGDMIVSGSTRSLGNAVKDACRTILSTEARTRR